MDKKQTKKGAARGTKIVTPGYAPMRGEPHENHNPASSGKMGGSPKNLSHTVPGASTPSQGNK